MATTVTNPASASAIPSLTAEVTVALADAPQVISRLALYDSAETKGRHTQAGMSILRYALERYVASNIDVPSKYEVKVEASDESIIITGTNKSPRRAKTDMFTQEIAHPLWLSSFFEDEDAFELLLPESEATLADALALLSDHVDALQAEAEDEEETGIIVTDEPDEDEEDDDEEAEDDEDPEEDDEEGDDEDEDEDEDDEYEDDDEDDDEEETEAGTGDVATNTCRPDADGACTNTLHQLGGEHGR